MGKKHYVFSCTKKRMKRFLVFLQAKIKFRRCSIKYVSIASHLNAETGLLPITLDFIYKINAKLVTIVSIEFLTNV